MASLEGRRAARWLLALSMLVASTGCAADGLSRADMDAAIYADCVRSGGTWYGNNQFGGSCVFRGPSQ